MCTRRELDSILKEVAKSYREPYGSNLSGIVLYGSYARGDFRDDSDVDVVAIVRGSRKQLQDKLEYVKTGKIAERILMFVSRRCFKLIL